MYVYAAELVLIYWLVTLKEASVIVEVLAIQRDLLYSNRTTRTKICKLIFVCIIELRVQRGRQPKEVNP